MPEMTLKEAMREADTVSAWQDLSVQQLAAVMVLRDHAQRTLAAQDENEEADERLLREVNAAVYIATGEGQGPPFDVVASIGELMQERDTLTARLAACADRLESLRASGLNVPQDAIDALRQEQEEGTP